MKSDISYSELDIHLYKEVNRHTTNEQSQRQLPLRVEIKTIPHFMESPSTNRVIPYACVIT